MLSENYFQRILTRSSRRLDLTHDSVRRDLPRALPAMLLPLKFQKMLSLDFSGEVGNRITEKRYNNGFPHRRLATPNPLEESYSLSFIPMSTADFTELLDWIEALGTQTLDLTLPFESSLTRFVISGNVTFENAQTPKYWLVSIPVEKTYLP